ncbi:hypothetical protein SAMN04488502_10617 [Dendrosporobacter quercicolus]|uniref:Uncharacterized protein n=1 Tax=Dendrosporobacter quercicolus TaxID=146817 RepID=A0A1G9UPE1_9FIRM|nr:hypothetical protein [Dendrosporobacter quercicolus]SDM61798.1 hypothetical protein SAMN04488502_10617 [Dendrosporobacter quercicolus]
MQAKLKAELPVLAATLGLRFHAGQKIKAKDLKKLRKRLKVQQAQQGIVFVHGKGKRKPVLQRAVETVEQYLVRQKKYDDYNHSFGGTKQLFKNRPGRHLPADERRPHEKRAVKTRLQCHLGGRRRIYRRCCDLSGTKRQSDLDSDAEKAPRNGLYQACSRCGIESEENYSWCEKNGLTAFIKPSNHDKAKTPKYKSDIGRRENMPYDAQSDCVKGTGLLTQIYISGLISQITYIDFFFLRSFS